MPAAVIPIGTHMRAEFAVLSLAPPGLPRTPFGILLLDKHTESLEWKLREDLDELGLSPEDLEYVSYLDSDFRARVRETSGAEFLDWLEDTLSGFLLMSERETVSGRSASQLLNRLFDEHVDTRVIRYKTHLPYYHLRAAATKFGEDSEASDADVQWVRCPAGLRPAEDLFVVQVVGRSMEPLIPDGSLAVFRRIAAGSRRGKRLLIEELGATGTSARFTVKRYTSKKKVSEDGEWAHETIRLEPLNPEFPAFELDPEAFEGRYRVIGEFVQVLDSDG
jgi:phage repressor protein C with HTH and peptisase S24 domain